MTEKEIRRDIDNKVAEVVKNMRMESTRLFALYSDFCDIKDQLHLSEGSLDKFWYDTASRDLTYIGDKIDGMAYILEDIIRYVIDSSAFRTVKK